jgi:hypothetical protein
MSGTRRSEDTGPCAIGYLMERNLIITTVLCTFIALIVIQCSKRPPDQQDISFYLPAPDRLKGWKSVDTPQKFTGKDLYIYMNGGAEIYLSRGFKQLITQKYINKSSKTITLEIFEMESTSSALEMYTSKIGNDGTPLAIGEEALLEDYYLNFRKENFLVTLTGFDSEKETIDGLITISKVVDERI